MEKIIVTLISTLGVIITTLIQTYYAKRKDNIETKLENLKSELKSDINNLKNNTNDVELQNCMNFLVDTIATAKHDKVLNDSVKQRFYENLDIYTNKFHKNSYIHEAVDSLKKDGII